MRDFKPVIERNETNGLSQAEAERDRIYDLFEQAAAEKQVDVLILKSPPFTSPPWVRVQAWTKHADDPALTLRSGATLTVRSRDFHTYPVEVDIEVSDDKLSREYSSVVEFDSTDAMDVLEYLLFERKSDTFDFIQVRQTFLDRKSPKNESTRLRVSRVDKLWSRLGCLGLWAVLTAVFVAEASGLWFAIGVLLLTVAAVILYRNRNRRRHVLSSGKPSQEPRQLIRTDGWQTVVQELGPQRDAVRQAIVSELQRAAADGFTVDTENIWHWGVDGKEERQQIVVRFRRGIAFVHVYAYGNDLFVGWDAHVNCGDWTEKTTGQGYDTVTKALCEVHSIEAGWHVPNEYDLVDAASLTERVHSAVVKVVKRQVAEHDIDQELDFTIVRETRQNIVGRQAAAAPEEPAATPSRVLSFRRTG